jgi:PAS domain S-box-containing protein
VSIRDISEQKAARHKEKAMAARITQQAHLLETVLNSSFDHIFMLDRDGRYAFINAPAARFLGIPPEDMLGKSWKDLGFFADNRVSFERALEKVYETGKIQHREYPSPTGLGARSFDTTLTPVKDEQQIIGVVVNARDMTERRQIEEALKQSEERFSKAFRFSPNGLIISHFDSGRYVEVNDTLLQSTGYSREEVLGKTSVELGVMRREDREEMVRQIEQSQKARNIPIVYYTKSGEARQGLLSGDTLLEKGFITALAGEANSRKKEYIITETGKAVVKNEIERLRELIRNGERILGGKQQ